ncbi:MAG: type II toxin-antitoxin system HicA family toxin [Cytophagales bacterium]|nr:MAG: type II toxin-antitoxin system HicA family toxin [Cytophagales bacterium]
METQNLSNILLSEYRKFLQNAGCSHYKTNSGHEHWRKEGLTRPITFQTHIDPVPEFIIQNALRTLGLTKKDFHDLLNK